jgi:FHS family Na+ dependent glucose MFS transporter 1
LLTHDQLKTVGYFFSYIALGMIIAAIGPTLPGLSEQTQVDLGRISYLFTAFFLGYMLGAVFIGRLFDRIRGHILMAASLAAMAVALALIPSTRLLRTLVSLFLLTGMAGGNLDVGCNTLLVRINRENVGPFINALHFFFGLGTFLSPFIIAWIMRATGGIGWGYRIMALYTAPLVFYILFLRSPGAAGSGQADYGHRKNRPILILCVLFIFLHVGALNMYGGWVVTYAIVKGIAARASAAYFAAAFFGCTAAGRMIAVPLSRRTKPTLLLLVDIAGSLVGIGALLLRQESKFMLWACTLCIGLSMASVFPVTLHFLEEHMDLTGTATGWILVGASSGGMTLPLLVGQFFESIGPHFMLISVLIDFVIAAGVLALMAVSSCRQGSRIREE